MPIETTGSNTECAPKERTPPQKFSVPEGDHSGDVDGHADAMKGAKLYLAEHGASASGPWTKGYEGSKSKFTMGGLTPGQQVWFRMAAFVGGDWTDWSDPATCIIL